MLCSIISNAHGKTLREDRKHKNKKEGESPTASQCPPESVTDPPAKPTPTQLHESRQTRQRNHRV